MQNFLKTAWMGQLSFLPLFRNTLPSETLNLSHPNTCTHMWTGQETFSCKINYPASWIEGAWHVSGGGWKSGKVEKCRGGI